MGEQYGGRGRGGGRIIYLLLQCCSQNDFCIEMGSNESHFNVSLIVREKVTNQCPQTTTTGIALILAVIAVFKSPTVEVIREG